jgi:hypothetical protein
MDMIDLVTGFILFTLLVNGLATFASALMGNYWLTISNLAFGTAMLLML